MLTSAVDQRSRCPSVNLYTMLDSLLYDFVELLEGKKLPVNSLIIRAKERQIADSIGLKDFKASSNWFSKFKRGKKLSHVKLHGESNSVNSELTEIGFYN